MSFHSYDVHPISKLSKEIWVLQAGRNLCRARELILRDENEDVFFKILLSMI